MKSIAAILTAVLTLSVLCVGSPLQADVRFPADAGVLDVTEHGAIPDDKRDDTRAIQALLDKHPSGNHIFYFPKGVYLLSDTLRPAIDDGVTKRNIFQGQSKTNTILKLRDGVGLKDAVIDYRGGPAQFFRNAVRDLTIDIGKGNPDATGIKFNASNQGTMRNVTIRSSEGGRIGLDMSHTDEVGPLLIADVTVEGFTHGVVTRWQTASQTFDGLTLRGQSKAGWLNINTQTVFAHRVQSENECTAVINTGEGRMVLINSKLKGRGAAKNVPAIRNQKSLYLRNVDTSGYGYGVTNQLIAGRGNPGREAGLIKEYWANGAGHKRRGGPYELFPSPNRMLRLPVEPMPVVPWDNPENWAGPHRFGGKPNDGKDDTAALQAAVDSGAKTIYLPRGTWHLNGVVEVRNKVRRILGTEAIIRGKGWFRIGKGEPDTVVIERLEGAGRFDHAGTRTLVLQHLLGFTYKSTVEKPGKLFLNDLVGGPFRLKPGQHVWARQLDIEGDIQSKPDVPARILNNGGTLWILGFKTEDEGTHIKTINGGRSELLGALHVGGFGSEPRYVTIDASFSAAVVKGGRNTVVEVRDGRTRRGEIGNADVYTGFQR